MAPTPRPSSSSASSDTARSNRRRWPRGSGRGWYETDDGTQVHLSPDPDHRPAARAHTALEIGDQLELVATRLRDAGVQFGDNEFDGRRVLFCQDPAGNRWELRGVGEAPNA